MRKLANETGVLLFMLSLCAAMERSVSALILTKRGAIIGVAPKATRGELANFVEKLYY